MSNEIKDRRPVYHACVSRPRDEYCPVCDLADTTPGSTLKVMRGPGGGLYLSGVEDLREGDVFRREVRG